MRNLAYTKQKSNYMKTPSLKVFSVCMALFAMLVWGLPLQAKESSSYSAEDICIEGHWRDIPYTRSLPSIPTASYDSQFIYIENPSQNCDITVTIISSTGEEVHNQTVTRLQTAAILIPIGNLSAGKYTLQLTNENGGCLTGTFSK